MCWMYCLGGLARCHVEGWVIPTTKDVGGRAHSAGVCLPRDFHFTRRAHLPPFNFLSNDHAEAAYGETRMCGNWWPQNSQMACSRTLTFDS